MMFNRFDYPLLTDAELHHLKTVGSVLDVIKSYRDRLRTPEGHNPYSLTECKDVVMWEKERRGVPAPAPDTSLVVEQFRLYGKMCATSEAFKIMGELTTLMYSMTLNDAHFEQLMALVDSVHERHKQE